MDRARLTNGLYHLLLVLSTFGIPLLIVFSFRGSGDHPIEGWIGAAMAFLVLLAYALITNRKRGK
ncbi:hypothetical protein [Desmospora profundinema]|uniref:Sulfopyruvate decarboxylase TPP-binding subunit n=1 Tax=Desmospora profundinema TaxID=1571184 RepID=A0ABU1IQ98_9BACL|nr:hypothetical protein [Desmospora profundinema]MDR6226314.1 sulfopyruvate decarboxylase TPP-binding subunit [Desmospora profundinema]